MSNSKRNKRKDDWKIIIQLLLKEGRKNNQKLKSKK